MDKIAEKKARDKIKRQDARMAKMTAGFLELDRWLCDLIKKGLICFPDYPRQFWESAAARLVDAQAPGAATILRRLRDLDYSENHQWQEESLYWTVQLWILTKGFTKMLVQPEPLQQQLLHAAGWGSTPKEVQSATSSFRVFDHWVVVGRQVEKLDDITVQRNWLYGSASGRFALVLYFAFKNTPIDSVLSPGKHYEATMVFFPQGDRAVPEQLVDVSPEVYSVQSHLDWGSAEAYLSEVRIESPWVDFIPLWVQDLKVARIGEQWLLVDKDDCAIRLAETLATKVILSLLGLSRGNPATIFLVATSKGILPMAICVDGVIMIL